MSRKNNATEQLAVTALFCGIILILSFTPIGYIQLPFIKATIIHVPVIIGSILLGPKVGAFLGFVFGLTSFCNNTFNPSILSFVFSPFIPVPGTAHGSWEALLITFIPRILVGVVPYYFYHFISRVFKGKKDVLSFFLSGLVGSMTNTLLVMNMIYFLFRDAYGEVSHLSVNMVYGAVLTVIFVNGVPEAVIAAVLTSAVCKVFKKFAPAKMDAVK